MLTEAQLRTLFEKTYSQDDWYNVLRQNFGVEKLRSPAADISSRIKGNAYNAKAFELGSFETPAGQLVGLYEVQVQNAQLYRNRRALRDLLDKIYQTDVDAALVVFVQGEKWRFTYVSEITVRDASGKRERKATDPKRYTYLFGKGEKALTAARQFSRVKQTEDLFAKGITLEALQEAFNVEKMSKAFFDEYRKHYGYFTAHLTGEDEKSKEVGKASPFLRSTFNGDKKEARDFIKKMMGRIVFLYFLEKKGWLGVPVDERWGKGDEAFLSNLYNRSGEKEAFYSNVLVPLFFNALNTDRKAKNDAFKLPNGETFRIPFLNGGLFEEDDYNTQVIAFPKALFANLFEFFDRYNFTVYEGSPDEHTVAVDPEMLGHIFENLLEDNKDKGAYYTPKEIVHYMCRESLIEYLYTKLNPATADSYQELGKDQTALFGNEGKKGQLALVQKHSSPKEVVSREAIEKFIKGSEAGDILSYEEAILTALHTVKVCDPAIGSGAFPMGVLMEIFHAVETLFEASPAVTKKVWKLKGADWVSNRAAVKMNIIQASIYGVDIEQGAVDIARLRFWLSLVVDEEVPQPLPNLDYKIVVGNSLLSKFGEVVIDIDWNIHSGKAVAATKELIKAQELKLYDLQHKQHLFFVAQHGDKQKLKREIRNLKIDILVNQLELTKKSFTDNYAIQKSNFSTESELKKIAEYNITLKTYTDSISKLKALKASKDELLQFFDWKLDFPEVMNEKVAKEKSGFDVVIANPPYGAEADHTLMNKYYTLSAKRLSNTYSYFIEKSMNLINLKSNLTLIVPNTWLSIKSTKKLRKALLVDNTIKHLLFTHQVFQSMADVPPIVDTVVFTCIPKKNQCLTVDLRMLSDEGSIKDRLLEIENENWSTVYKSSLKESTDYRIDLKESSLQNEELSFMLEDKTSPKYFVRIGTQEYAIGKGIPPLTKNQIKERIYHSKIKLDNSYQPFIPCGDIQRFHLRWSETFLKWGDNLHCPREKKIYTKEHIVVSRIFDKKTARLKACYIAEGTLNEFYINNTDSFCVLAKDTQGPYPLKFILGLINSKLIGHLLTTANVNLVRSIYPKINTNDLKNIPVAKNVDVRLVNDVCNIVDSIINTAGYSNADSQRLDKELNLLVYKLYELPHDKASLIEGSTDWMSEADYNAFTIE